MRLFLTIFFLFLLSTSKLIAQSITFTQLHTENLEEDKRSFSTNNDEIIFLAGKYDVKEDTIKTYTYTSILVFDDSTRTHDLSDFEIENLHGDEVLFVALVEVDNNIAADSIATIFKTGFNEYLGMPSALLHDNLNYRLQDDDLLELFLFNQQQFEKLEDKIILKGIHFFNRYEYVVYLIK